MLNRMISSLFDVRFVVKEKKNFYLEKVSFRYEVFIFKKIKYW